MIDILDISNSIGHRIYQILKMEDWTTHQGSTEMERVTVNLEEHEWASAWTYAMPGVFGGFVHMDENAQPLPIGSVMVDGVTVPTSQYRVDYQNGWIIFDEDPEGVVRANLSTWDVRVVEGFPQGDQLNNADLPSVAYSIISEDGRPLGIGTVAEFITYKIYVDVLASNDAQRKLLGSRLRKMISWLPLYEFEPAYPLSYGGSLNLGFSPSSQYWKHAMIVQLPKVTWPDPVRGGHDKLIHRAMVNFEIEITG